MRTCPACKHAPRDHHPEEGCTACKKCPKNFSQAGNRNHKYVPCECKVVVP